MMSRILLKVNAVPFNMNYEDIEEALDEFVNNPPTVSEWLESGIGREDITAEDIVNAVIGKEGQKESERDCESPLFLKYKAEAVKDTITSEEYYVMRNLNKEQKEIVMFNGKWMKESIVKMKERKVPDSYQIFLSGSGGTGKSYVIKMIYHVMCNIILTS